jgi:hypothetical protein
VTAKLLPTEDLRDLRRFLWEEQVGQLMHAEQLLNELKREGGDLPGELQLLQSLQSMQLAHCSKLNAAIVGSAQAESSYRFMVHPSGANDGSGGHCTGRMSRPTYRFISDVVQPMIPSEPQKLPQSSYTGSPQAVELELSEHCARFNPSPNIPSQ